METGQIFWGENSREPKIFIQVVVSIRISGEKHEK
jgi:hypothetical protein